MSNHVPVICISKYQHNKFVFKMSEIIYVLNPFIQLKKMGVYKTNNQNTDLKPLKPLEPITKA